MPLQGRVVLKPDITWQIDGTVVAVADAKYKAEKPAGYPNADLYQLLAYCTVLGLPVGHLIYAAGNEEPVRHVARGTGVEIICHALDLSRLHDDRICELDQKGLVARTATSSLAVFESLGLSPGDVHLLLGRRRLPDRIWPHGTLSCPRSASALGD